MANRSRSFSARFLSWLDGLQPLPPDPLEFSRRPEIPQKMNDYHNQTIKERWLVWKASNGKRVFRYLYNTLSAVTCLGFMVVLLFLVSALPPFGDPGNPTVNEVPKKYIEDGVQDTGAINIVTAMILDYRAFDTFSESCVLFVAVSAVLILLRREGYE